MRKNSTAINLYSSYHFIALTLIIIGLILSTTACQPVSGPTAQETAHAEDMNKIISQMNITLTVEAALTQVAGEMQQTLTAQAPTPMPDPISAPTEPLLPTLSPTPEPPSGTIMSSPVDGMTLVYIPSGIFPMGSSDSDPGSFDHEKPQHNVYLDGYWIDQTPITNYMYAACVQAGHCSPPAHPAAEKIPYDSSVMAYQPIIYVSWFDAEIYCEWAGRRLPTEAEWEKAARGTDGRLYPWGENKPHSGTANFNNTLGITTDVGEYPEGASPFNILDMAGNVRQWVADWYQENYYAISPDTNPLGPESGTERVLRGGAYSDTAVNLRSATRFFHEPGSPGINRGFRCAVSIP
jgi:formylglycine-generating enzyme required for sulfatase activity